MKGTVESNSFVMEEIAFMLILEVIVAEFVLIVV
jgi:hypothetical protein